MSRKDRNRQEKPLLIVDSNPPEPVAIRQEETQPIKRQISFDDWWTTVEYKYKLKSSMKEAVRLHFKARGFLQSGDFTNGIKDFGIAT